MINLRELRTVWRTSVLLSAVLLLGGVPAMAGEVSGEFSFTSSIFEVGEGDGAALITVTRHGGRHGKIVVPFSTIDGTATNDVDYISVTNNLVFFDSQTRAEVVIPILDNQEENENKTVTLRIYDPLPAPGEDAMLTPMLGAVSEATLNILDNDTDNAFNFARRFYQVGETAGQIEITVIFRGDAAEGVSVDYETRTGNFVTRAGSDFATEDEDFGSVSGTLEFAAAGSQTIAIPILADGLLEFNEDFQVVLFNPQREDPPDGGDDPPPPPPPAVIGQLGTATVTILPDRSPEAEHPAGSVDLDFNPDNDPLTNPPLNRTPGANNAVYALALQPDGKIVLGGEFTSINARNRNRIARVESDGSLDESFHPGTGANDFVNAVTIMQEEGEEMKLLIGGGFSSINGQMRGSIARLNADGSLDAGFSSGLGADGPIHTMVGTPEGILVGGDFNWFDGRPRNNLALLTPEGELDTSFDPGLGANGPIYSMLAQMVEALSFGVTNSGIGPISLSTNLNTGASSGSVELTYNFFDVLGSLRVYQGTNLVHDTGLTNNIQVVEVDGVTVTNFPPIVVTFPYGGAVETALRFEVNEQPEDEEGEEGEEPEPQPEQEDLDRRWEFSAVIRPARTGAILAGGDFTTYNGEARNRIVRLLADGSIDQTFGVRTGANGPVHALVLQPDQKILLGGGFSGIDGIRREGVARLNPDGTMDRTFDPGAGADHPVFALALQADGRILAGGTFASFNGVRRIGVARLYENGVLDTSFMDTAFNQFAGISDPQGFAPFGFVSAVAVDGEGGVLIGGGFTHLGGGATRTAVSPRYNYARLIGGETEGPGNLEFQFEEYGVDENGGDAVVTLVRSNGSLGPVSVEFTTVEGVALAELDFTPVSTNVVWGFMGPQLSMGLSTTNVVRIPILDDDLVEGDETFTVELSHPRGNLLLGGEVIPAGASLGRPSRATVTIYDDDFHTGTLSFSEAEYSVIENAGSATITVNRTEGTTGMVTVRYATSDGSALEGTDYASTSGMLIFSSGQTNRTFTIPIWDNTLVEEDKTVNLRLFSPSGGARVGEQGTAVLTIIDDDFKPGRISFASTNYTVLEGEGLAQIGVQRRGGSAGFLSVQFRTREGTARAPFDFSHASGALSWSDGEAGQKFFTVPIQDNTLVNPDKTVLLELFDASVAGALTSRTNAVLTIENDDFYGELSFNSAGYLADENGGPAIINVIRRDGSAETVSVMYESSAGTATEGVDYTEVQGALVFGPGETSKSFLVPIHDNDVMDGNRTVELRLSNPMLATLGEVGTAVLTIVDDETVNRPAGSLDRDFRIGAGPNNTVYALAIQEDGRLFVGGDFTDFDQHVRGRIVRLTREGEVDETFEPETEANGTVRTLLVQDEGRIVLGGNFSRVNDRPFRHIARLSRTGALDTTFDPGAGADQPVYSLADLGRDYKLVAGGAFTLFNSRNSRFFAQLNQDGTLDSAFQAALGANGPVHAVKVLRDGKVLLGGGIHHDQRGGAEFHCPVEFGRECGFEL